MLAHDRTASRPAECNLRIAGALATAAVAETRYRLRDFVSSRARHDLIAMHQYFARLLEIDARNRDPLRAGVGASEVLGLLEQLLDDPQALQPYLASGTPTRLRYLADLDEFAQALRAAFTP